MKGVIFTEFTELVESQFGLEELDAIIVESAVPSGGIYTAVGTYHHSEMVALVSTLSRRRNIPVDDLLQLFGNHLFQRFTQFYPELFQHCTDIFEFLSSVENHIHVEVLKLYPDAELPRFETERISENVLNMHYYSDKSMGMLAIGLINGALQYFEKAGNVSLQPSMERGQPVIITIELLP